MSAGFLPLLRFPLDLRARPALQEVHRREGLTEWIESGGSRTPKG